MTRRYPSTCYRAAGQYHPASISQRRTLQLSFQHEHIAKQTTGFLNKLAQPPSTALQEALILSRQIVTSAPLALAAAKRAINAATDGTTSLEAGLDLERALYNPLLETEDRQEGLLAFKEKRRARFSGR